MREPRADSKRRAVAALLLATLCWGSTFALVKEALREADALSFLALRFSVALGVMALASPWMPGRGALPRAGARGWLMGAATGAALYGGFFFQTEGLRFTSAANSAFLTGLCVILVPFLLWLGGRRPRGRHVAGALAALWGLYALTGADLAAIGRGDALTLACAVSFALHIVCLGAFGGRLGTRRLFAIQMLAAALLAWGAAALWGGPVRWRPAVLVALGVTGALGTTLAFFLQTWAQRRLEPSGAALWLLAEPLFALLFGRLLLGESPSAFALAGAGAILAGMAISQAGGDLLPVRRIPTNRAPAGAFATMETKRAEASRL